jgi:lipoyl synthase
MTTPESTPAPNNRRAAPPPARQKIPVPGDLAQLPVSKLMNDLGLNTVCQEARCPNIFECWSAGTATFMILGDICTRACTYCAVAHGRPATLDIDEPRRVGEAVEKMALKYAVITSVDRDDLPDGGAGIYADTIRDIKRRLPDCRVEVLIPDFKGEEASLRTVLDARPDVLNHNTETVPRLYRAVRSGGKYSRLLELLDRSRHIAPDIPTKTGMMMGLGEEHDEVIEVFRDLRKVGVSILTLGQYLRPSENHAVMTRYYHPDEFKELKRIALGLGFIHVEAGPLVRSSYHAHEQADAVRLATNSK